MPFKYVNLWQSSEERQAKYHLILSLGVGVSWARAMRDWPLVKIERRSGLDGLRQSFKQDPFGPYAQFLLPGFSESPGGAKTQQVDVL